MREANGSSQPVAPSANMGRKTSRRTFLVLAGLGLVGVVSWALWPQTRLTLQNFERIEAGIGKGMTVEAVEDILGRPPNVVKPHFIPELSWELVERSWSSGGRTITVMFEKNGTVTSVEGFGLTPRHEELLDKLRRLFRL